MPAARILSLSTSVPPHVLRQQDVSAVVEKVLGSRISNFSRFLPVYQNAAIDQRHSCMPLEWYEEPASLSERNALYLDHALQLLEEAAIGAVEKAGLGFSDIDGLIVVSSSGIATPSLDALLMERLRLKRDMERLPIFGLGCGGGVIGLARTAQLARGAPEKRYLYMVVELCGLNFLHSDSSKSNIIATALFSDGASAAVVSCDGEGPEIIAWGEYTQPDSLDVMGWEVTNAGLKTVFSQDIPFIIRKEMRMMVESFLKKCGRDMRALTGFLCHPGGAKVMDAIEESMQLRPGSLTFSRDVLRRYGNMSAATVMFVLEAAMKNPVSGEYLMSSFGPGFTAGLLLLAMS